ncbi:MAG TPA: hypothetical protein VF648_03150 [Pyrinomonadaceae bacterium]|jgi:hypothetical protein
MKKLLIIATLLMTAYTANAQAKFQIAYDKFQDTVTVWGAEIVRFDNDCESCFTGIRPYFENDGENPKKPTNIVVRLRMTTVSRGTGREEPVIFLLDDATRLKFSIAPQTTQFVGSFYTKFYYLDFTPEQLKQLVSAKKVELAVPELRNDFKKQYDLTGRLAPLKEFWDYIGKLD